MYVLFISHSLTPLFVDLLSTGHRRPSFEAELFGDIPSNAAAEVLLNDKDLANV